MKPIYRSLTYICLALSLAVIARAQQVEPPVQIIISEGKVRFAARQPEWQLHLIVQNQRGETLYDSGFNHVSALSWGLADNEGKPLSGGLYRYALTLRDNNGVTTHAHKGSFILEQDADHLWITTQDETAIGTDILGGGLTVTREGGRSIAGLHTTDGKSVKRDVNGRELIDEKDDKKSAKQEKAALSGTANIVAKFDAGGVNLINSSVTETGGNVGIGTTTPQAILDMVKPGATDVVFRMQNATRAWSVGVSGAGDFWRIRDNTAGAARLSVSGINGNVGVGTTAPTERLEVAGKVKLTGIGNGIIFPDGSTQTTAATGGGGDITEVNAGAGLTGGATSGAATLGIAASGVTATELAANAVTTAKIADANVTTAKLANASVTDAKIADVAGSKITGSITTATIPGPSVLGPVTIAVNALNANSAVSFSGALAGDVTGNQSTTKVEKIQNLAVPVPVLADNGKVIKYKNDGVNPPSFELAADTNSGGTVTGVTASGPLASSGGVAPNISLTGVVPIANGGTGAATQNFVDLSNAQTIAGVKTFSSTIAASISGNAATATNATNFTGVLAGDVTGTQSTTLISNNAVTNAKLADASVTSTKLAVPLNLVHGPTVLTVTNSSPSGTPAALFNGPTLGLRAVAVGVSIPVFPPVNFPGTAIQGETTSSWGGAGVEGFANPTSNSPGTAYGIYGRTSAVAAASAYAGYFAGRARIVYAATNLTPGIFNHKALEAENAATFDTTSGLLYNYAAFFRNLSTRSTGSGDLHNVGILASASGAQFNYAAIFDQGNVGIGTHTPTSKLHVVGDTNITGNLTYTGSLNGNGANLLNLNGANITGTLPVSTIPAGSDNYIQNQNAGAQASANFNISGNGTAGGTFTGNVVSATTQFNIGVDRVLSIAGVDNTFVGFNAGVANTTGGANSFLGTGAGAANTTGGTNSFFGTSAGGLNTTGGSNSFFGATAGRSNTTGQSNSFFGREAGFNNTTGGGNSFYGHGAGNNNTTGTSNAFFGLGAGGNSTTADGNAFFGTGAGASNTTGFFNSFFGRESGVANTTGNHNSFYGIAAGLNTTTGSNNVFLGRGAAVLNTTGSNNTVIGSEAGASNITESNNTFIGTFANGAVGINNATALGAGATVTQSDSVVLGNNAAVGIGVSAPKAKLDVRDGNVYVGTAGQGMILKSPDGATCRLLTIDNAGALALSVITCP